jgi:hypothetical protein
VSAKGHTFRPKDSPWAEPVKAELKRLCRERMTTALIADALYVKFRHPFTRNAVIGQMHKLKISNGIKPRGQDWRANGTRKPGPKPRRQSSQHQWASSPHFGKRPSIPLPRAAMAPAVIDPATQVSIFDHREGQCRWPVTEVLPISAFRYCGGPVMDDACPWCTAHWRMSRASYRPAVAA